MKVIQTFATTCLAAACLSGAALAQTASDGESDCGERISNLEETLAADSSISAMERQAFSTAFQQAGMFCQSGNNMLADQYLTALEEEFGTPSETPEDAAQPPEVEKAASPSPERGEPREDLDRFFGLYALPDQSSRKLFVAPASGETADQESPQGFMMVGAMWGDVANWHMKSVSDTQFEQIVPAGGEPVVIKFEVDETGQASAMSLESPFMSYDRMERAGDLPDDWTQ